MRVRAGVWVRCDFLLAPIFLLSLAALLVNDFVLKPFHPGWVSGFLSDAAGMVFFPVVLVAAAEVVAQWTPRRRFAAPTWFAAASGLIVLLFVSVKFTVWGESLYVALVAVPVGWLGSFLSLGSRGVVADPWDLLALLFAPAAYLVGRRWRSDANASHPAG